MEVSKQELINALVQVVSDMKIHVQYCHIEETDEFLRIKQLEDLIKRTEE